MDQNTQTSCFGCAHCMGAARLSGRLCIRCELAECCPDPDPVGSITFCGKDDAVAEAQEIVRDILPPGEELADEED